MVTSKVFPETETLSPWSSGTPSALRPLSTRPQCSQKRLAPITLLSQGLGALTAFPQSEEFLPQRPLGVG